MKIEGQVALVTGANRGIGKAIVEALLKAGAAKVYAAARDPKSLEALVAAEGGKVVPLKLDVTRAAEAAEAAAGAKDVTLLVNNAGTAQFGGFLSAESLEPARLDMETNYFGVLNVSRAFAPVLKANGGGALATVASIVSFRNFPSAASYSASKAATQSLVEGLRAELAEQGTFVAGVYPGPIDTDMARDIEMEKVAPSVVGEALVAGLAAGQEMIFPDPTAQAMYSQFVEEAAASWKGRAVA